MITLSDTDFEVATTSLISHPEITVHPTRLVVRIHPFRAELLPPSNFLQSFGLQMFRSKVKKNLSLLLGNGTPELFFANLIFILPLIRTGK